MLKDLFYSRTQIASNEISDCLSNWVISWKIRSFKRNSSKKNPIRALWCVLVIFSSTLLYVVKNRHFHSHHEVFWNIQINFVNFYSLQLWENRDTNFGHFCSKKNTKVRTISFSKPLLKFRRYKRLIWILQNFSQIY